MTMSALTDDQAEQRRAFRLLRELREAAERSGHRLPELSMGMSGDYADCRRGGRNNDQAGHRPVWGAGDMSDDHAFHLTPLDVRSQEFTRALRGYDRNQVDEFKLAISEELERLIRDRAQHEERLRSAQEQLRCVPRPGARDERGAGRRPAAQGGQQGTGRARSRAGAARGQDGGRAHPRAGSPGGGGGARARRRRRAPVHRVRRELPGVCWSGIWARWMACSAAPVPR